MFYYILILIAVVLLALQFSCNKLFQSKIGNNIVTSLTYTALCGLAAAVVFFCINGCKIQITPFSLLMAVLVSLLCLTYNLIGFKIFSLGSLSVYMMFLMLGGMLLPYLYGVFFLKEPISVWRILGVVLLAVSMIFPALASKEETKGRGNAALFVVLCLLVFVLNGGVSIVSKIHQITKDVPTVESSTFVVLTNGLQAVFSGIALLVVTLCRREHVSTYITGKKAIGFTAAVVVASAALGGTSYLLQLEGAANVPASVLYPLVTGGSVVLSAVAGAIFFKERPSKATFIGLLLSFAATFLFLF